jgi:hypothetical protein
MADIQINYSEARKVRVGATPVSLPSVVGTTEPPVEVPDGNYVPYTGANADVDLGAHFLKATSVKYNTSPATIPTDQGSTYWNDSKETLALVMNGVTYHYGQDVYYHVKNSTGATIPKGRAVRFAGTDGASGHVLIAQFIANGSVSSNDFMGVTAEDIVNGAFGKVVHFGEIEGIDTSGFTAGTRLYASTTVAGAFQTTIPVAPNNIVLVCATLNSKVNGEIIVRPTIGSNINNDEGVKIISPTNGQALLYNSSTQLWENATISGQVPVRQVFAYTSSNTFTLSYSNPTAIYVALNGQVLEQGGLYDWTISGTTLTVTTPLLSGDEISILYYTNLPSVTNYGRNIDGGAPDSVYLAIQNVDGGTP